MAEGDVRHKIEAAAMINKILIEATGNMRI
jgi:hypothetical protein